ncbi:MAG: FAD-dependent oxidoreductase [Candidatus Humimicrobiaceae bacterium]
MCWEIITTKYNKKVKNGVNVSRETLKKMNKDKYDIYEIIVIGSGLAGSEAGIISANFGLKTLIINISMDNPSVLKYSAKFGGIINEVLLNKINSLGGFLGSAIYENKIAKKKEAGDNYFGFLNIVDKRKFSLFYKYCLENKKNLDTRQGLVTDIVICNKDTGKKYMIKLSDGSIFFSRAIIISVGTFLNSNIFWGKNEVASGRHGEINSKMFYESLKKIGYDFKKEGVFICPRIDKRSLNLKRVKKIKSEENENIELYKKIECAEGYHQNITWQKYYSFKTKISKNEILKYIKRISKNYKADKLEKLLNISVNKIKLEDSKTDEFEIEMFFEGDRTMELYVNEFDFAFSDEEQSMILSKFYGLENAAIIRPGYCIEYEGLKKEFLRENFESNIHENIFFAGEVNGPAHYESIALQGLTAGINASKNILENK